MSRMLTERTMRRHLRKLHELQNRLRGLPYEEYCPHRWMDSYKEEDLRSKERLDASITTLQHMLGQRSWTPVNYCSDLLRYATQCIVGVKDRRKTDRSPL